MADAFRFNLEGVPELQAKLKSVREDVRYRGGRFALRKAANLVRDKAKSKADSLDDPATARTISDNIVVRWSGRTFRQTGDLHFRIGVKGGGRTRGANPDTGAGGATPHWHFLELGTSRQAATPFMRPALEDNAQQAGAVFVREYKKAIDRAIKRAQRQQGGS